MSDPNRYPSGWDEERVKRLIEVYDGQSDEEAIAEDEAAFENQQAVVNVPLDLVAQVRKLISDHQRSHLQRPAG